MISNSPKLRGAFFLVGAAVLAVSFGVMFADVESLLYSLRNRQFTPEVLLVLGIIGMLLFPLYQRWHHILLVAAMNSTLVAFFLPGTQPIWAALTAGSLLVLLFQTALRRRKVTLLEREVIVPLGILLVVVLVTAYFRGGISGNALGSDYWGGGRYILVLSAIVAPVVLASTSVPKEKRMLYASIFVGSQMVALASDVIPRIFGEASFLLRFFSANLAQLQLVTEGTLNRMSGVAWAGISLIWVVLIRYPLAEILSLRGAWKLAMVCGGLGMALLGGYRSGIILLFLLGAAKFWLEGLHKTRFLPQIAGVLLLILLGIAPVVPHMPLSIQRALSFLPYEVDHSAKMDADATATWRWNIWMTVLPTVPDYLLLGKGLLFDGTDLMLTRLAMQRNHFMIDEGTLVAGDYHSGILTLLIPFGLVGMGAFLWLLWRIWQVLMANYRWGDPDLRTVNTFLLAVFLSRGLFFFTLYGQFDQDLVVFTGLLGMSVCLNGGVKRRPGATVLSTPVEVARPMSLMGSRF